MMRRTPQPRANNPRFRLRPVKSLVSAFLYLLFGFTVLLAIAGLNSALLNSGIPSHLTLILSLFLVWSLIAALLALGLYLNLPFSKAFTHAVIYLVIEFGAYMILGGFVSLLVVWGVPGGIAFGLGCLFVVLLLVVASIVSRKHDAMITRSRRTNLTASGEVKLADWIAQTLAAKAPREWEEYQDWLHDILLDRRQSLEHGNPHWRVTAITYWRLSGLCLTVSLIKLRRLAIAARRLR